MAQADPPGDEAPLPSVAAAQDTVEVFVGRDRKRYTLHKALLMHHSGYLRGALSGSWLEAENKTVTLVDAHTGPFNVFVNWIYNGKLPPCGTSSEWLDDGVTTNFSDLYSRLTALYMGKCNAYVLADMLIVPKLKRALLDTQFMDAHVYAASKQCVVYSYTHLPQNDPYLQLLVDGLCWFHQVSSQQQWTKDDGYPYEFLARVVTRLLGPDKDKRLCRKDYVLEGDEVDSSIE